MSEPLILVKWHDKTEQATKDFAARQHAMKRVSNEHWDKVGIELYQLPPGLAKKSAQWLIDKGWAKAEIDGEMLAVPVPNVGSGQSYTDLISGNLYYQNKVGVPKSWAGGTAKDVKIGDVDSGANHNHEWLKSSIVASKNFVANEDTVNDNEGHGTATAGIIKAIARDCQLVIARAMSQNVCKWSAWGPAVIWCVDQGCVAVNSSIGGPSDSFSIVAATAYAADRNVPVLCAAGNAGTNTNSYPAASTNATAVAATDVNDARAGFSQWGDFIDITAPGVGMVTSSKDGGYSSFSGTSGSTPVVTGCVGVVVGGLGVNGKQALDVLFSTARNLGNPQYFGAGMPDLLKALDVSSGDPVPPPVEPPPPETPPPVTNIPAVPNKPRATNITTTSFGIEWDAVAGAVLYDVYRGDFRFETVRAPRTSTVFPWAAPNQDFKIRVLATNGYGSSALSEPLYVHTPASDTPPPPPPPPPPVDDPSLPTQTIADIASIELAIPNLSPAKKLTLVSELQRLLGKAMA